MPPSLPPATRRWAVAGMALILAGCATPAAERQAAEWRSILAAEAPPGAPAAAAEAALRRRGIDPQVGTFTTVRDDGARESRCPDPAAAVTGSRTVGRVGFNSNVLVITVCLDDSRRVVSSDVGIWIQ